MVPSGSVDAVASTFTVSGGLPVTGAAVNEAVGFVFAWTVTCRVVVAVAPRLSVTVSVTVIVVPGVEKTLLVVAPVAAAEPSLNVQA